MGKSQRTKGASGERECVSALARIGISVVRVARNGVDGAADLSGDGIAVEVKRRRSLATLDAWIDQARQACAANQTPLVCMRSDRGAWMCMVALDDLDAISRVLAQHRLQIMGE